MKKIPLARKSSLPKVSGSKPRPNPGTIVKPTPNGGRPNVRDNPNMNGYGKQTKPNGGKGTSSNGPRSAGQGNGGGQQGGKKGPKRFGGYGGYQGVNVNQVRNLVNSQVQDALKDLRDDRQEINQTTQNGVRDANQLYNNSVGDINHIFNETGQFINQSNQQVNTGYTNAQANSAAAQNALAMLLTQQGNAAVGGVNSELSRLGIQGGADMGALNSDIANLSNVANISGTFSAQNLEMMKAGANSIGSLLSGMNEGSRGSSLGRALNNRNDSITDLRANKMDAINQVREATQDVKGQRGDLTNQLLQQLQQTGWAQYVDNAQLQMSQEQHKFNMNQARQQAKAQRLARKRAQRNRGRSSSGSGSSSGSSSSGGSANSLSNYGGGSNSNTSGSQNQGVDSTYADQQLALLSATYGGKGGKGKKGSKK